MAPYVEPLCAPAPVGLDGDVPKPVYYSDFVVRRNSTIRTLKDLRGSVFAFNDETSLSGFHCVRYWHSRFVDHSRVPFFSSCIRTGGHVNSLKALLSGRADVAAIENLKQIQPRISTCVHFHLNCELPTRK